jgi:hypothetical protein
MIVEIKDTSLPNELLHYFWRNFAYPDVFVCVVDPLMRVDIVIHNDYDRNIFIMNNRIKLREVCGGSI